MTERQQIASADELGEGERIITEVNGISVGVFNIDGEYHALANYCPHQSGPLCEGPQSYHLTMADDEWNWEMVKEGEVIECPWHKWTYDIKTGENLRDNKYSVPKFEVEIENNNLYLNM